MTSNFIFGTWDELVDSLSHLSEISLSYCFSQIEFGYRRILYVGLVRKHRLDFRIELESCGRT